jgi:hypothetical protein
MGLLTYIVGAVAIILGVVLWTMFTFVAVDQDDRLLWRVSPALAGAVSGALFLIIGTATASLLLALGVTGLALVLSTIFLGSFEATQAQYLADDEES